MCTETSLCAYSQVYDAMTEAAFPRTHPCVSNGASNRQPPTANRQGVQQTGNTYSQHRRPPIRPCVPGLSCLLCVTCLWTPLGCPSAKICSYRRARPPPVHVALCVPPDLCLCTHQCLACRCCHLSPPPILHPHHLIPPLFLPVPCMLLSPHLRPRALRSHQPRVSYPCSIPSPAPLPIFTLLPHPHTYRLFCNSHAHRMRAPRLCGLSLGCPLVAPPCMANAGEGQLRTRRNRRPPTTDRAGRTAQDRP